MQKPLAPEESMKHLVTLPDFEVRLFAAEPNIAKPIWMRGTPVAPLDCRDGGLSERYATAGQGHDQIKICEDTDGDGRADKFTVFADKLSVPTGLVFANAA